MASVSLVLTFAAALLPAAAQDLFLASSPASSTDLQRARSTMPPGSPLAARTPTRIAGKVNNHLRAAGMPHKPCEEFTHAELNKLVRVMSPSIVPEFQKIYQQSGDSRALDYGELAELEHHLAGEGAGSTVLEEKCAEVLMVWAHHLSASGRGMLQQVMTLPSLPVYDKRRHSAAKFTCVSGHNNTEKDWDRKASSYADGWPDEIMYNATGHGPYPFWLGPAKANISDGAPLMVWWSKTKQAEKFYHQVCQIGNAGYSQSTAPCYSLMLKGTSYFYTAAEDFCCISGSPTSGQKFVLTASQFDWYKDMTYQGVADYEGEYHSGKIKNYTMDCSGTQSEGCGPGPFHIWYYTDLEDRPIEHGEGCQIMPRTSHCNGATYLFHQYDPSTWTETAIDPSVFEVPSVCKSTTQMCLYP